jgi:hypothetical protein
VSQAASKWYQKTWAIVLSFIVFFPLAFLLVWRKPDWSARGKKKVAAVLGGLVLVAFITISVIFAPPSVDVTSALSPVKDSGYTLTGKTDAQGATVMVNGRRVSVYDDKFSADLDLKEGNNTITIVVTDGSKQTTKQITIHRYTKDEIKQLFPVYTHKDITETRGVHYGTKAVKSSAYPNGSRQITTAGVNGKERLTFRITYRNGEQVSKDLIKTMIILNPVTQVTTIGTYVAPVVSAPHTTAPSLSCPNGSYINSYGNRVCSPSYSPSVPAGATAKCADGTYSYSQHHSGTCSHHGGVAQWL